MSKRYENLENALCRELDKLDRKYAGEASEMNPQDAERADLLYHALKSAETYHAMADADWDMEEGSGTGRSYRRSYANRRDSMGRYMSRDMGDGSGHYPMMYPREPMSYGYPGEGWRY